LADDDPETHARIAAFRQALDALKYELVIQPQYREALDLDVPVQLQQRADYVIERIPALMGCPPIQSAVSDRHPLRQIMHRSHGQSHHRQNLP
jgi:hypothetical protein